MRLRISWDKGEVIGVVDDTPTATKLFNALPCSSTANTWGDEVYFAVAVDAELEPDARQVVPPGTICFWAEGRSLAIPFGPTPVSRGNECRLVAKVNVLGKLEGDPRTLKSVCDGDRIRVEAA
ncbi:MAG TPA: cyclophilin-like family protein [Verrucomicrobiae bacterium]|nr:cyclophilin-like family protein [Verrucomicrobiae bacterium]